MHIKHKKDSSSQNKQTYYLHYDQVGTLRAVSDANHNIIKEISYDTYGNILQDTNKNFKVPFGLAGGLADRDTNLVHFGYREYDSYTGKWTAKDPIDFAGGDSNLYGYVLGDPVDLVDVEGLAPSTILPFIPVGIGIVMYTYNQFTDMANGADYASNLKVCSDIIAQYDFLIDNVDNMCMSDMEKSIYQLQLNEEKNKLFLECLQVIGKN
ncbi:RHS repeat domain-containing protein [Sulfurimonas sp.]